MVVTGWGAVDIYIMMSKQLRPKGKVKLLQYPKWKNSEAGRKSTGFGESA